MERDINLQIEEFKQTIVDTVNHSGLPISVAYYILKDIMNDFTDSYKNYLEQASRREKQEALQRQAEETVEPEMEIEDN